MIYKHKKTGGFYVLLTKNGVQEATMEKMVVYLSLGPSATAWIRPHEEFFDGRFELVSE